MDMDLISFVPQSLMIVIVATYVLGVFFKNTTVIKNNEIPMILLFCSIVFSMLVEGFNVNAVMQGIICYGVSTGVYNFHHELEKQKQGRD